MRPWVRPSCRAFFSKAVVLWGCAANLMVKLMALSVMTRKNGGRGARPRERSRNPASACAQPPRRHHLR